MSLRTCFALTTAFCGAFAGCISHPAPVSDAPEDPPPADSPGDVSAESPDAPEPGVEAPAPAALGPDGCPLQPFPEPELPAAPLDFCLAESLGPDGEVVERVTRRTSVRAGVEETETETTDDTGRAWHRGVSRRVGEHLLFESSARLDLPPDGTLPNTYGQPATWSVAYTWDASDHVVELARDLAMDGLTDSRESWRFDARGTVREHRQTNDGTLYRVETFDAAGQPLTSLDSEDNGRVWTYGSNGLLTRDAYQTRGQITQYTEWDLAGPERPRASRSVQAHTTGDGSRVEETVGERHWTYDATGRLLFAEGWHRVDGFDRQGREEFDAAGRVIYSREDTEDGSCHRYEQRTRFADGPSGSPAEAAPVMLDQMTTCDGALFQHIRTDVDAAGRPVRVSRVFAGNPMHTTHQLDEFTYDRCGAIARESHHWDDRLTRRITNRRDERGRLVERTYENMGGAPATTTFAWDGADRLIAMGERRFTYDAAGRLTRVELGEEAGPQHFEGPVVAEVRYVFACDAP